MEQGQAADTWTELLVLKERALEKFGITLDDRQLAMFARLTEMLLAWNEKINLTTIIEPEDIVIKHYLDSLAFIPWIRRYSVGQNVRLCDLGTGAGFPGLPIKIAMPELKLTLIDSLAKRINFLNQVILTLDLPDVITCHARAEDIGRVADYREKFDIVVARAVAELPILLEYAVPLLKVGGVLLSAKGVDPENEIRRAQKALAVLSCKVEHLEKYSLAEGADNRSLIIIKKILPTASKYPRQAGKPKKNPLC